MHLLLSISKAYIHTHYTYRYTLWGGGQPFEDVIGIDRCVGEKSLHKVK